MTTADLTVFLDFDGVLHPLWEPAPDSDCKGENIHGPNAYAGPFFVYAPILVELLASYLPHLDIVISSTWGHKRDLVTLKGLLPTELAARVKDAVHHHLPPLEAINKGENINSRWTEIAWYRENVRPDIGARWLAIDNDNSGWPAYAAAHLAYCNHDLGDPLSRQAIEDALLLCRAIHPFAKDIAARRASGQQSGAIGLDEYGTLVVRGEDGELYPFQPQM
ncbi:HAD domain-containing protein [Xanthomonas sp. MUS 060]|uniref:HAD domain-containing protein n=1 Tax=Xanthomonas sp. MUS 060 TaxID=1588031 RepID=UPI0005F2F41B|nr:HAD domain-containing protein [Xanthomonas sp. MUS 060]